MNDFKGLNFDEMEYYGRQGLLILQELYPGNFKYEIHFTEDKSAPYDAYYFIIDKDTQNIIKRVWIEIKIRMETYNEYIVETKKINSLIKKRKDMFFNEKDVTILYLNFCLDKTVIYNIDMIKDLPKKKLMANKCTVISRTDKVKKSVIYLNETHGKVMDFIISKKEIDNRNKVNKVVNNIKKEIRGLNWLFELRK